MPRKKIKEAKSVIKEELRSIESYKSLILGIGVVVVVGILIFVFFKNSKPIKETSSTSDEAVSAKINATPKEYIVQKGDDLWNISEKVYKSGYYWIEIAKLNKLANPGLIFSGDKLVLPEIKPENSLPIITEMPSPTETIMPILTLIPTPTPTQAPVMNENSTQPLSIISDKYTIVAGDDLWNIAVRAYGDGYKWVEIAKANNLDDPNLIFSGNTLKLPR